MVQYNRATTFIRGDMPAIKKKKTTGSRIVYSVNKTYRTGRSVASHRAAITYSGYSGQAAQVYA
jgi:hypothetical protein